MNLPPPHLLNSLILTIYVPVFFVLSGYLVHIKNLDLTKEISKKARSLLRPFAIVYLFSFGISAVLDQIGFGAKHEFEWTNILNPLFSQTFFNGPIWFLLALFWAFVLYYCVMKLCNGRERYVVMMTLCIGLTGFYMHRWGVTLPLFFAQGMVACPMLMVGSEMKKYLAPMMVGSKWVTTGCMLAGSGIYLLFRKNLSFQSNIFEGCFIEFMIGILGGSIAILCLSFVLEKHLGIFAYWGRYSLVVLCLHNYILIPSTKVTGIFITNSLFWAVSNFVIIFAAFLVLIPLVCRICPSLFNIKKIV